MIKGSLNNIKTFETHYKFYLWNKNSRKKIVLIKKSFGCWECISHSTCDCGYPKTTLNRGTYRIFRIMYGLCKNNKNYYLKNNMLIRHTCDNRLCCNPDHLIIGTNQDNTNDMKERGRTLKGINNPNSSLTETDVNYIMNSEMENAYIAMVLGVSTLTVKRVRQGITYKGG